MVVARLCSVTLCLDSIRGATVRGMSIYSLEGYMPFILISLKKGEL